MFDGSRSGQSNPYFSGSKRRRDSLLASKQSSLQPYLMGTSGVRSPTQKRTRLSLGGNGNNNQDIEWSSFLNFQTSLRPARQRDSSLRRRETIHSLPGQPTLFSKSSNSFRGGLMSSSPGFCVRDRNERQTVARALQILDSRKRLRELPTGKQRDELSEDQEQLSSSSIDEANKKRRRLTINGTLDDLLSQEQTFASTSLGEIANKSAHCSVGVGNSSSVQKRMFTSSVLSASEVLAEPSSKRQRPGVSTFAASENLTKTNVKRTEESQNESTSGQSQSPSNAAQRRRLLSYITPAQVEARYARQSAATELLARSRSTSKSTTPTITRRSSQVMNSLATTGAQTELSCNQKEVLQKSPKSEEVQLRENADETASEHSKRSRRCQLSVKEFVAHLDRARSSTQKQQPNDVLRRNAADNEARKERLNRLRKLLSDVTKEPTPPPVAISAVGENRATPTAVSSVLEAPTVTKTSTSLQKLQSFGFGQTVSSAITSAAGTVTPIQLSTVAPTPSVAAKSTNLPNFGITSTAGNIDKNKGQQNVSIAASIPSSLPLSISSEKATSIAKPTTIPASSLVSSSHSGLVAQPIITSTKAASVPSNTGFSFGQSGNTPSTAPGAQTVGLSFGQVKATSAPQSSVSFVFGQSNQGKQVLTTEGNSSKIETSSTSEASRSKVDSSNPPASTSVITFGQKSTPSFSFGETKQPIVNTVAGATPGLFSFGQSTATTTASKSFSFVSVSSSNTANTVSTSSTSQKPASTSTTNFNFGSVAPPTVTTTVSTSGSTSVFPQAAGKETAEPFTFGSAPSSVKPVMSVPTNNGSSTFGQQTLKTSAELKPTETGSLFSFTKPSATVNVSSAGSCLFGFGTTASSNGTAANSSGTVKLPVSTPTGNSQGGGGFSFTTNHQVKKTEFNSSDSSSGLFSFGQTKGSVVTNTVNLFGNDTKKSTDSVSSASNSSTQFSFGSNTVTQNVDIQVTSTAAAQPFSFGTVNGGTPSSTTQSFMFGNSPKPSFVFGKTTSTTTGSGPQAPAGTFSFGTNQAAKEKQLAGSSVNPTSKTNGTAGFTFNPPPPPPGNVTNQPRAFSFGGPPTAPSGLPNNSSATPFTFGGQQNTSSPQPPTNMFSQTNPTSAPRKKVTGLLRKRSTRK